MNTTSNLIHSAKETVQKLAAEAQEFAHREPTQATAVAVGIAMGWHLLPTRFLFRTVALAAGALAQPALLTLGAMKAFEIYRASHDSQPNKGGVPSSPKHSTESQLLITP